MPYDIRGFQKRYALSNRDIAGICGCSLPTIQKWRSGEVPVSGAATQLMRLLDLSAESNPARLRELIGRMNQQIGPVHGHADEAIQELESSMNKVVDRLELMLQARRKEAELAESEARYRSMLETNHNPICRWLPDTTLTYVNKAYSELFSDFGDSLLGRKWLDFIPQEKRSSFATIISDIVRRGEEETSVHESIDKAGRIRHQEWKDIPVKNSRGEVVEFHSVGRDITELVNCRNELEQLRRTSAALMDLCPLPALIFDARGKFVEMNHRFEVELMAGNSWRSISDMAEGLPVRKFGRLLARLSEREDLCYSMNAAGRIRLLRGRLIGAGSGELKFLAVFEDMGGQEAKPVLHVRLRNEVVVDGKERPFLIDSDASGKIRASMEALGHRLQVDRIYVFSFDHTDEVFDNVLEWCADGITPHIEDLKGVPMSVYPWWIKRLMKQQWIQVEETSKMPRNARNEMEILQAQGIGALLVAPLVDGDKVVGFAGFDQNDRPRIWHEQELKALQAFKGELEGLLASTLGREQNGDCA